MTKKANLKISIEHETKFHANPKISIEHETKFHANLKISIEHETKFHATLIVFIFSLLLICTLISCNQDSIFADIAVEPLPVKPRINGSSTNLVIYDGTMYVASKGERTIHTYKDDSWGTLSPSLDKIIIALAATDSGLYALVANDNKRINNSLYRFDGSNWGVPIEGGSGSLQSIWGAEDTLFIGAKDGTIKVNEKDVALWKIFYVGGTDTALSTNPIISSSGQLNGAAVSGTDYYIATGNGIYSGTIASLSSSAPTLVTGSTGNIAGILNVNDIITAVTRNTILNSNKLDCKILRFNGTSFSEISSNEIASGGPVYTGAMCVWKENNTGLGNLLLLGIQATQTNNKGYRELTLVNGVPATTGSQTVATPGDESSSVPKADKNKYEASLAKYNIHHILQAPDGRLFASTTQNGVWVLGSDGWNAQD